MSQNKSQLELPPIPHPPEVRPHDVHNKALGGRAVLNAGIAVAHEQYADTLSHAQTVGEQLQESKQLPGHVNPIKRFIGRRKGTVMTDEESQFVIAAANIGAGPELARERAAKSAENANTVLEVFRFQIANLDKDQRWFFNQVYMSSAPKFMEDAKVKYGEETTWTTWLSEEATDAEVLQFLHWHLDSLEAEQHHPEVRAEIAASKERYKSQMQCLATKGIDTAHAIEKIDSIKVYIGDIFDVRMLERGGYHTVDTDNVVLAGAYAIGRNDTRHAWALSSIKSSASHEYNHAVLGGFEQRWMNEAVTEDLAMYIDGRKHSSAYQEERDLYVLMLTGGAKSVDSILGYQAYAEQGDDRLKRDAFDAAVLESWKEYIPEGTAESVPELLSRYIVQQCWGKNDRDTIEDALKKSAEMLATNPAKLFADATIKKELPRVESS
jgi:hypothetical protein